MKTVSKNIFHPSVALSNNLEIANGSHILYTFSDREKYINNIVSFIVTGLEFGHGIIFIEDKATFQIVLERLVSKGFNEEKLETIVFSESDIFYETNDVFNINSIVNTFSNLVLPYISKGIPLRSWARVKWMDNQCCLLNCLKKFELEADSFVESVKSFSVCAYNGDELPANIQLEIMKSHPFIMTDMELYPSSLYQKDIQIPSFFIEENHVEKIKKLKDEFQYINEHYKNFIEESPDGVFITINNEIVHANKAATKMLECNLDEVLKKKVQELFLSDDKQDDINIEEVNGLGESVPIIEKKLRTQKGQTIDVEVVSFPFIFTDINKKAIITTIRNITERKTLQRQLSNQLFFNQTVFDSLSKGIIVVKNDLVIMMNKIASDLLCLEYEEKDFVTLFNNIREKGKILDIINQEEQVVNIETINKNGKTIEFDYIPISGDIDTYILVLKDMTYRKKIEEELFQAKLTADQSNHMKTIFLSQISHDLRTPLNTIQGFTQILLLEDKDEKKKIKLQRILRASHHLLNLIDEIIDFTAIETGNLNLKLEQIQLKPFIEDCIDSIIIKNNVSIELAHIDKQLYIQADYMCLRQVLNNILTNAVKYNIDGGFVYVDVYLDGSNVKISIADTGIGIPKDQLTLIFEPFYRVHTHMDKWKGSGLGLAIVSKLVKGMNGNYGVHSEEGMGTTFWISFEVMNLEKKNIAKESKHLEESQDTLSVEKKVLYIEDNLVNIELVEAMLEVVGNIELFSETEGKNGCKKAVEMGPDLILLDLGLQDMSGLEVLKWLQSNERTKNIPIIVLSADALESSVEEASKLGCTDYITKPIEFNKLKSAILNL